MIRDLVTVDIICCRSATLKNVEIGSFLDFLVVLRKLITWKSKKFNLLLIVATGLGNKFQENEIPNHEIQFGLRMRRP